MTLLLTLASAVAISSLSTAFLRHPLPFLPQVLARCSNANIDHIDFTALDPQSATYQITVYFKNMVLADSSSGLDALTCTLYSTIQGDGYGDAVSLVNLFHTAYTIASNVPNNTVVGSAEFGVGIIDRENLSLTEANELFEGSAPDNGGDVSMAQMKKNDETPKDSSLIRVASTSFGGTNARGLAPGSSEQTIQVDLTQPYSGVYPVDSSKVIVNQISLKIKGIPGADAGASVQLKKIAIMIQSLTQ